MHGYIHIFFTEKKYNYKKLINDMMSNKYHDKSLIRKWHQVLLQQEWKMSILEM